MTPHVRTTLVKRLARELGFDRVGIATLAAPLRGKDYREWLSRGHAGSMRFLHRHSRMRTNPSELVSGSKYAICVAASYRRQQAGGPPSASRAAFIPPPGDPSPTGRIAEYARGMDYHRVLRKMLRELIQRLKTHLPEPFVAEAFVDTGPILERELAAAAGIGWIGKSTMLMNQEQGTFILLGEILTSLELVPDEPIADHCGTCTRCLDACPTQAFPAPYQLDASKCISYWTIEHRGEVPPAARAGLGDWVFGCDVCQDVCPFNSKAASASLPELLRPIVPARVSLPVLRAMTTGDHRRLTRGTALARVSKAMWARNAQIAEANASSPEPS